MKDIFDHFLNILHFVIIRFRRGPRIQESVNFEELDSNIYIWVCIYIYITCQLKTADMYISIFVLDKYLLSNLINVEG